MSRVVVQDWILTIPMSVEWADYERELAAVADGSQVLNYRLGKKCRRSAIQPGDRIWIVHRGKVRGYMKALGITVHLFGFHCTTTGRFWEPGLYLQRSGDFAYVDGPAMKGFQGVRRFPAAAKLIGG